MENDKRPTLFISNQMLREEVNNRYAMRLMFRRCLVVAFGLVIVGLIMMVLQSSKPQGWLVMAIGALLTLFAGFGQSINNERQQAAYRRLQSWQGPYGNN